MAGKGIPGVFRTLPAGKGPVEVAAADFNGDGKLDLAVDNFGASASGGTTITLLFGTGTGAFNSAGTVPVDLKPTSVAVGDFNGDDKPDLATVSGNPNELTINLNNGDGTFAAGNAFPTAGSPGSVVVADSNSDQKADVAVGCASPAGLCVLLGNGDGTFGAFTSFPEYGKPVADLVVANVNGDAYPDLVSANGTNCVGAPRGIERDVPAGTSVRCQPGAAGGSGRRFQWRRAV